MSDSDSNPRCEKCGLMKQAGIGGSMTSWLSVCKCESLESLESDREAESLGVLPPVRICRKCNKRINIGRAGSFTQWVFRADVCTCEVAEPGEYVQTDAQGNIIEAYEADEDEEGIDVDGSLLPLDRYKPLKEIGKGAWGSVYLCRDKLLGTQVAVKCLKATSDDEIVSFQKEAKLISKLEHPNIIKVYDFGVTESDAPYMVMEYFDGVSLKAYIEALGPLPVEDAISLLIGLTEALSYTHKKEIFHRDVTSLNIIVKRNKYDELVGKLVDFGIALEFDRQSKTLDYQGMTVEGTPAYMAPDQANGRKYDARSEVYSLGCVLFEAVTGKVPFEGNSPLDVLGKHASVEPPDPGELNPALSDYPKLTNLIEKSLKKDPDERVQTMQNFRAHLLAAKSSDMELSGAKTTAESKVEEEEISNNLAADSDFTENIFSVEKDNKSSIVIFSVVLLVVFVIGGGLLVNIWNSDVETVYEKNQQSKQNKFGFGLGELSTDESYPQSGSILDDSVFGGDWRDEPVYKFQLHNETIGDATTYISGHKARLDWNGQLTMFLMPPKFDVFYICYAIEPSLFQMQTVKEFFQQKFNEDLDYKVTDLKLAGEEKLLGYQCQHYSCRIDGIKLDFWATKDWNINETLAYTCSQVVGVPPGYGIPLKAIKTYTKKQIESMDKKRFPATAKQLERTQGVGSKTISWMDASNMERIDDKSESRKLFYPVVKYRDQQRSRTTNSGSI